MSGPGRPGQDDQMNFMGIAAGALGWDFGAFLQYILGSAQGLDELRNYKSVLLK